MYAGLAICHCWLPVLLITELPLRKLIKSSSIVAAAWFLMSAYLRGKERKMGMTKQKRYDYLTQPQDRGFSAFDVFIWTYRISTIKSLQRADFQIFTKSILIRGLFFENSVTVFLKSHFEDQKQKQAHQELIHSLNPLLWGHSKITAIVKEDSVQYCRKNRKDPSSIYFRCFPDIPFNKSFLISVFPSIIVTCNIY